jgi:CRP-like cAMP-binding protein
LPNNLLLDSLPFEVRDRLGPRMKTVDLPNKKVLYRPGEVLEQVYFPLDCIISITVTMAEGRTVEAGAVGSREMVGLNAFMGDRVTTQTEYITQVPGSAVRVAADALLQEFDRVKEVRDVMLRFTQAYIAQLSQNAACNRIHQTEQRAARWLLESRDRLGTDELELSQEFLAEMVGVHRPFLNEVLGKLQDRGLLEIRRRSIRIADVGGLGAASCECFGVLREELDRLLASLREDRRKSLA